MKICASDRCFFPRSAFMSSQKVAALAKNLGYETVEFHPTWAVWLESLVYGRLTCASQNVSSFHISWREDGLHAGLGFLKRNIFVPGYRVFPFEPWGTGVLQKLEKKYKKEVVVHWREDFNVFANPIVELHSMLEMDVREIIIAVKEKKIKGIVIDTDKFFGWMGRTRNIENRNIENRVLEKLLPYVCEVHFRFGYRENIDTEFEKSKTSSVRILKKLVSLGYEGRVVVEIGWPDKGSAGFLKRDGFENIHKKIVGFLKGL